MDYILKMPYPQAFKLINKAREQNRHDMLFKMYITLYPNFNKKTYMTFEEYEDKCNGISAEMDNRTKEEIMNEIMEIENKFKASE